MIWSIPHLRDRLLAEVSRRKHVAAGLVDAGLASLATFCIGVYAVRILDPAILGGYALVYQAIFLVGIVPANLFFTPAEVAAVSFPVHRRLDHLGRSLLLGTPAAVVLALGVLLWLPVAPPEVHGDAVRGLTITAIAAAFLSPVQDHVRKMLHSGGASWHAAAVSTVQLVSAVAGILVLTLLGVPAWWIPFGALALANFLSLAAGLVAARLERSGIAPIENEKMRAAELVEAGRWLVGWAVLSPAAGFAAAALVSRLAGAEALGYAEAARVIAQPVWVLAVGLSSVLGPPSMEAGKDADRERARRISTSFVAMIAAAGAGCVLWFGADWWGNPLAQLLPTAYAVPWLVAATIVAQTVTGMLFPFRSELLGARQEAPLTRLEIVASLQRVVVAATARWTYAYAIPLGYLALGAVRWLGYLPILRRVYGDASEPRDDDFGA